MDKNEGNVCTFDNYIFRVDSFKKEHPGGANLIEKSLGRDVGKFIYGAYTYGEYKDYQHSLNAHSIIKGLAHAKLGYLGYTTPVSEDDFKHWRLIR